MTLIMSGIINHRYADYFTRPRFFHSAFQLNLIISARVESCSACNVIARSTLRKTVTTVKVSNKLRIICII